MESRTILGGRYQLVEPLGRYLDEQMLPPQWMDAGIFLQSVMLLLRDEGLDSRPRPTR